MAVDHVRIEKIGDLGEVQLQSLCVKGGLTPTKTGKDKFGWDFFIEFPINRMPLISFDAQPPALTLLCQVKATDNFDGKISIKMSNWERLAATPLPAFVLVFDFAGGDEPVQTFLCPINVPRVGATLKRMRELEAAQQLSLHKHEMVLTVEASEKIEGSGKSLKDAIVNHAGYDLAAYSKNKLDMLEKIGFEAGKHLVEFDYLMTLDKYSDALLGIGEIQITGGRVSSLRFGIPLDAEILKSGTIRFNPVPSQSCDVILTSPGSSGRISLKASVYAQSFIDKSLQKIRISTGSILDILISQDETRIKISIQPDVSYRLSELISAIDFLVNCNLGSKVVFRSGENIISEIIVENKRNIDPDLLGYREKAVKLREVLDIMRYRDDVTITLRDLCESHGDYHWMNLAIEEKSKVQARIDNLTVKWNGDGIFATMMHAKVNGKTLIGFFYWDTSFRIARGKISGRLKRLYFFDSIFMEGNEGGILRKSYKEFEDFCREKSGGTLMMQTLAENNERNENSSSPGE